MKKIRAFFSNPYIILTIILFIAFGSRFINLAALPDGTLPDEAYGAYNAYGLMTEGIDTRGYSYPVYFVAWGSGMSVLYSYLAIPFFKLLGVCIFAYRIPQALFSFLAVLAIYVCCKECFSQKSALFIAFILAINPWSIMNARFGLDANMAPSMFMLGFCFLILGIQKSSKYFIPSALFLGMTLYCYALSWIMVPFFLCLCLLCFWKRIPYDKYTFFSIILLFLIALPLILFLAINLELLPEIRTPVFSIPLLQGFRGEEMSIANILSSLKGTLVTVLKQYDGASHTSSSLVGAYYYITTPFMLLGIIWHIIFIIKHLKFGDMPLSASWLLWLISAGLICILNENITTIHINLIHIPIIFYGSLGIIKMIEFVQSDILLPSFICFFLISFLVFSKDYYPSKSTYFFGTDVEEVLAAAERKRDPEESIIIYQVSTIKYSNLLWMTLPPVSDFYNNAVYDAASDVSWQELESYHEYRYITDLEQAAEPGVYILPAAYQESFFDLGYQVAQINERYAIAYK